MELSTSFWELRELGACPERYRFLAKALGGVKRYGVKTPIPWRVVREICGKWDLDWLLARVVYVERSIEELAHKFMRRKKFKESEGEYFSSQGDKLFFYLFPGGPDYAKRMDSFLKFAAKELSK